MTMRLTSRYFMHIIYLFTKVEDFDENPKSILQKEGESIVSNTFPHWMIWSDIIVLSW